MEARVYSPEVLDESGAFRFMADLSKQGEAESIVLDFSRTRFAYPLGSLMLVAAFRTFVTTRKRLFRAEGIDIAGCAAHGYLGYMGFFKSLGVDAGKRPGEAAKGATYVPITILTLHDLEQNRRSMMTPTGDLPHLGDAIEKESMRLAALVTQDKRPRINRPIAYCFREIIRNVFEHAEIDTCAVYAQKWTNGFIETAIVDRGIGIHASLLPRLKLASDAEALRAAITPGVSSKRGKDHGVWSNSGFGLYILSELGKQLGIFTLCSGITGLRAEGGHLSEEDHIASFTGTAVGLKIRQLASSEFSKLIQKIADEGEAQALGRGESVRASKSSRMSEDVE